MYNMYVYIYIYIKLASVLTMNYTRAVPAGCSLLDMIRPVREAVPNATVRLPKKIIDSDLTCAICMNVIEEVRRIQFDAYLHHTHTLTHTQTHTRV